MAKSETLSGALLESGYADHPEHTISISDAEKNVTVEVAGVEIARTRDALVLHEANYEPVIYVPKAAVDLSALRKTDHHTWCPFKGEASYYSIGDGPELENVVWTYEDPFVEVSAIVDHFAFYTDRVELSLN